LTQTTPLAAVDKVRLHVRLPRRYDHPELTMERRACGKKKHHYDLVHAPAPSGTSVAAAVAAATSSSQSTQPGSRPGTPPRDAGTPTAAGTPTSSVNKDGTVLLDCVGGCGRPVRGRDFGVNHEPRTRVVLTGFATYTSLTFTRVCQISSNRYASHLSNCIGSGTGTRRAAARNATSKSKYAEFPPWCYLSRSGGGDIFSH
jgi:hypothetical protein